MVIEVTKEILEKLWYGEWDKELVNQILKDHGKARKFDEIKDGTLGFIRAFNWLDKNKSIFLPTPNTPEPETPQPSKTTKGE